MSEPGHLSDIKARGRALAPVTSIALDPAAPFIALGKHKRLEIVDLKSGAITEHPQPGNITALAYSPRGSRLAIAFGNPGESGGVQVRGTGNAPPQIFPNLHHDTILDVAFSSDGRFLATCGYDMQIKLISLEPQANPPSTRTLKEHSDAVYAVAFSPDSKMLASCSADRAVKVWDVASGKLLYTLGDATDWLYTLAWSPDGKLLASGGVDKSIRVYEVGPGGAKIVTSVFAHEAAVQKIVYGRAGKTLFSLGQDRVVKAWDAQRMVETKTYERLPETGLCLAVRGVEIAVGRYDGVAQIFESATGKVLHELEDDPFPRIIGQEGNDSPGSGQWIKLPASVIGKLSKPGEDAFYRFEVVQGQQLGAHVVTKTAATKFAPYLELTDTHGRILAEATDGTLGYTFAKAGTYALGIRDQEYRGGAGMNYRLDLGEIPVVTSLFPLGLRRGTHADIHIQGVFLGADKIRLQSPMSAEPGTKLPVQVVSPYGKALGKREVVVGEFAELSTGAQDDRSPLGSPGMIPVPGTANGRLQWPGQKDTWKFMAAKGRRLILETNARRLGSALDSVLEVLDMRGDPVPRAVLRCQAKTFVTFRDHDSAGANIRIESWGELKIDDMIYVGGDLMKIRELPTHPDADCSFFGVKGQRRAYFDTTPTHHSMNEPMYMVTLHAPGTTFPPNGYPVFTLNYRNDDGGPAYGRDSRILFDPPADGTFLVRVADAYGQGGDNFGYRLTVRPPRPSFNVRFSPTGPVISRGSALSIQVAADRLDGYEGPIDVHFENLPPGFSAPPTTIEAGQTTTDVALYADVDAKTPPAAMPLRLVAEATVAGDKIRKETTGETPKTMDPGDIVTFTEQTEVALEPGHQVTLTVQIERRRGFTGRVPLEVRGLPHGVRVLDIGLNGILVNENEARRAIVIYAEPWVAASSRPIVVLARREGKNTEHAAKAVILKVGGR